MSILKQRSKISNEQATLESVESVLVVNAGTLSADTTMSLVSMESLTEDNSVSVKGDFESIYASLDGSEVGQNMLSDVSDEMREISLENASILTMGVGDQTLYQDMFSKEVSTVNGALVVNNNTMNDNFTMESFDQVTSSKYAAQSVVLAALGGITTDFEQTFYPTTVVEPGVTGVNISVQKTKVVKTSKRGGGTGASFTLNKISTLEAYVDPSRLEKDTLSIVPYAVDDVLPEVLVPRTVVSDVIKEIDGVSVPSRPILFNKEVDYLDLSSAPGLIASGAFDRTDSIDSVATIGKVWYKVTAGAAKAIFMLDVSSQPGGLLTQTLEGERVEYHTTMPHVKAVLNQNLADNVVAGEGDVTALLTAIEGVLSIAAGTKFTLSLDFNLSAYLNIETGNGSVNVTSMKVDKVFDTNGEELDATDAKAGITITDVGYIPGLKRTNLNLRRGGIIIDGNTAVNYHFGLHLATPVIIQKPISSKAPFPLREINEVHAIRNYGRCVEGILSLEKTLRAGNAIPSLSSLIGSEVVSQSFVEKDIDITTVFSSVSSDNITRDVRGHLLALVDNTVNQLIKDSNYLIAMQSLEGNVTNWEAIVATDPHIKSCLDTSSDVTNIRRDIDLKVTAVHHISMRDKIYISFRRKDRNNKSPLDFGMRLLSPSFLQEFQATTNGSTVSNIYSTQCSSHNTMLPILGVINVSNMNKLFEEHAATI